MLSSSTHALWYSTLQHHFLTWHNHQKEFSRELHTHPALHDLFQSIQIQSYTLPTQRISLVLFLIQKIQLRWRWLFYPATCFIPPCQTLSRVSTTCYFPPKSKSTGQKIRETKASFLFLYLISLSLPAWHYLVFFSVGARPLFSSCTIYNSTALCKRGCVYAFQGLSVCVCVCMFAGDGY